MDSSAYVIGQIIGIGVNLLIQFVVWRYLFVYYFLGADRHRYEQKKVAYNFLFIFLSVLTYPLLWILGSLFWPFVVIILAAFIYFAVVLNRKWNSSFTLPDPFTSDPKSFAISSTLTPEQTALIQRAWASFNSKNYEAAMKDFIEIIQQRPLSPNSNFGLACIYSFQKKKSEAFTHLSKAVQQGFTDLKRIHNTPELAFLLSQEEFVEFERNGYKFPPYSQPSEDVIAKLERLAKLKEQGALTDEEFQSQKKKILS